MSNESTVKMFLANRDLLRILPMRNHLFSRLTRENPTKEPIEGYEILTDEVRKVARKLASKKLIIEDNNIAMSWMNHWMTK